MEALHTGDDAKDTGIENIVPVPTKEDVKEASSEFDI